MPRLGSSSLLATLGLRVVLFGLGLGLRGCLFCFVWCFVVVAGVVARLDQSIEGIEVSTVLEEKSTLNKLVADEDIDSD
jgi:hypothetical protein